jgi:alpha-L-fucosidase
MPTPAWFAAARFGLFVHWGPYSRHGWEPSWPLVGGIAAFPYCQDVPVATYYADALRFAPPPGAPREWMRLARRAGMTYAVLTTKHHDGFTLFPCAESAFGVAQAGGHDLVGEFVSAARAEGLRVGLYYSLADWRHPDYPAFTDAMRPYPFLAYPRAEPACWARFLADMRAQLTHLLTAYGPIDLLWFDGGWERSAGEWEAHALEAHLHRLQPGIVLNDRLPGAGDYDTPEQSVPVTPPTRPWETCLTMNHSWGNVDADREWKSTRHLLTVLTEVAGGGGNLLLNVSPDGDGGIPAWQVERLDGIATWMARHGEAIAGTGVGLAPGQFYGPTTRRGERTFLFCPMRPEEFVVLRGVHGRRILSVRALGTDRPLPFQLRLAAMDRILGGDPVCDVLIETPGDALDPLLSVIEVRAREG